MAASHSLNLISIGEKFSTVKKDVLEERKMLPMIDLTELKIWGDFGMHWKSGAKYTLMTKDQEASETYITKTDEEENVDI